MTWKAVFWYLNCALASVCAVMEALAGNSIAYWWAIAAILEGMIAEHYEKLKGDQDE